MSKKLTHEFVKEQIEKEDYKLLTETYINAITKLKIKCDKNHIFEMKWNDFQQGHRCAKCYHLYKKRKYDHYFIKEQIEKEGYNLLSTEYIKNSEKMLLKCDKGHEFNMSWNCFQQGVRCSVCNGKKKHSFDYIKEMIHKEGYILLSEKYKESHSKLKVQCNKGHIFKITYANFKSGSRCGECCSNKKLNNNEIIERLNRYEEVKENKYREIEVECKYCGKWYIPDRQNLRNRIYYIEGRISGEYLFYCSDNCKQECPIFGQIKYPKGFKPVTSREVQPQLRKLVFEKDNYTCQKCNIHQNDLETGLHCHHIDAVINNPIESADVDNCITLCKTCHKKVHKISGCGFHELRCSKEERRF